MIKRYLLIVIAIICSLSFMIHFKSTHSAKERLREAGIRYYRMGWYDDADECFSLALKQKEAFSLRSDKDIYYYLADGEMKRDNYANAIVYYDKLINLGEEGKDLYGNLGLCYHEIGKDKECYDSLKKAAAASDADTEIIYTLMVTCQNLGYFDEVQKYADEGYKLVKKTLSTESKELMTKDVKKSGKVSSKVLRELREYGTFAYLSGEYTVAYTCYDILMKQGHTDVTPYVACCLADKGEYEEALDMLLDYTASNETNALCDAKIVYCYMQLGKYKEALSLVDKAMSYEGQGALKELLYEKGVALEYTGDFNGAYECFREYVGKYPDDEKAKREYDFLLTRV
jgi:tetratricopeptide (TPR) repeat protein